jgi:hypothetical protein
MSNISNNDIAVHNETASKSSAPLGTVAEEGSTRSKIMTTTTGAITSETTTFEKYLALAEKSLQKSRKSLDTRSLIELAYGDDTEHIGGSDMLIGILDSVLDKIAKETVLEELKDYGTSNKTIIFNRTEMDEQEVKGGENNDDEHATATRVIPKEHLGKIDQAISHVVDWEERRDRMEGLDAKMARDSLHQNLLPDGVTIEDVIAYREHVHRLQARTALKAELQRIEDEISVLRNKTNEKENKIREQLGQVKNVEQELEASANICAMVTT